MPRFCTTRELDLDRTRVAAIVAIDRHQHHVHEGRLAGLVELLLRIHGVVVVQGFVCSRPTSGDVSAVIYRVAIMRCAAEPVAAADAHAQQAGRSERDKNFCSLLILGVWQQELRLPRRARSPWAWRWLMRVSISPLRASSTGARSPATAIGRQRHLGVLRGPAAADQRRIVAPRLGGLPVGQHSSISATCMPGVWLVHEPVRPTRLWEAIAGPAGGFEYRQIDAHTDRQHVGEEGPRCA